jgi:hypothetical protein
VNKGKTVDNQSKDNLTKEVDLRKITTSPIVIVYEYIIIRRNLEMLRMILRIIYLLLIYPQSTKTTYQIKTIFLIV